MAMRHDHELGQLYLDKVRHLHTHSWTPPELHERMFVVDAVRLLVITHSFPVSFRRNLLYTIVDRSADCGWGVRKIAHACLAELLGNFRSVAKVVRNRKRHKTAVRMEGKGTDSIFSVVKQC